MYPNKLLEMKWEPIGVAKPKWKVSAIYMIGEPLLNSTIVLYLGRSKDVRRRIKEHLRNSAQKIDKYIKKINVENIMIKWVEDSNQKYVEGKYLNYIEYTVGYQLPFNIKSGDGTTKSARITTTLFENRSKYFRPSRIARKRIRPFPKCAKISSKHLISRDTAKLKDLMRTEPFHVAF